MAGYRIQRIDKSISASNKLYIESYSALLLRLADLPRSLILS